MIELIVLMGIFTVAWFWSAFTKSAYEDLIFGIMVILDAFFLIVLATREKTDDRNNGF